MPKLSYRYIQLISVHLVPCKEQTTPERLHTVRRAALLPLPVDLQGKLLRTLQEKEIRPLGSTKRIPINRILAATNRDLEQAVAKGSFRQDRYFRLKVLSLRIPPLRERRQDIPLLAASFLERLSLASARTAETTLPRRLRLNSRGLRRTRSNSAGKRPVAYWLARYAQGCFQ